MKSPFKVHNEFKPAGDQPKAISALVKGVNAGMRHQTLFGVTGSGKTFTCANVIAEIGKPTLVIAHNKTLAAQLAQEYREFFPNNSVHYFVSYYDYYQPEAYMPVTDTYIEKEAMINEEIERLRHASTQALLTRKDVIIVASVSCIYGLGSPVEYEKVNVKVSVGMKANRAELVRRLVGIHFERTTADLEPGLFRAIGNTIEVMPVNEKVIYRLGFDGDVINQIDLIDSTTRSIIKSVDVFFLFPAKHFITDKEQSEKAFKTIKAELEARLKELEKEGKNLEAERLKRRTNYDLAMIREIGYTNGIENYSRHFSGHAPGEPPDTLLSYFPHKPDGSADFLTIIDESHVTVPQLNGMYAGDQSRKKTLVEHGFRLPSARDNRPLKFDEFEERIGQTIYTTATPGPFEKEKSGQIVEQVIRPTGLIDPVVILRPVVEKGSFKGQIADSIEEAEKTIKKGFRVIMTTLTKKMAEDLTDYLKEKKIKTEYLHSDVKTIDRIDILTKFRRGEFDVVVGVNLLREGLDLPEVALVCILDADKEGFLRSETALIQIIGRAARNIEGKVIIYADVMTGSIERAVKETERRRKIQTSYNEKHGITPKTIIKSIKDITDQMQTEHKKAVNAELEIDKEMFEKDPKALIKKKESEMNDAVKVLDFETAAILRDEIKALYEKLGLEVKPKTKSPRKKGFTLIELLVVISIVALLSSVVLASLNAAREKGRMGGANYFAAQVEHIAGEQAVGIWDFDDCSPSTTVVDRSGNNNGGTITGATWSTDTPSGKGCSLSFNGSTDYVNVPNPTSMNVNITQMTMSAWVKTSDVGYHHILSRGLDWSGGNVILATDSDLGYTQFCFYTYGYSVKNCSGIRPDGKWHHVVGTYDGTQASNNTKIYVDGIFKGTGTANLGTLPDRADAFRVANRNGNLMNGLVDSVRVYSKVLTGSEVGKLYAEGLKSNSFAKEISGL